MEYGYPKGSVFYRKLGRAYPLVTHGEGIYLYDEKGKRYIDGSGGALVVNIGHGNKEVLQRMVEQIEQVGYVHGHTFSHHPVACAVGLAVLRFIQKQDLLQNCQKQGDYLIKRLEEFKDFPFVGDVRGKGLMTAIEFVKDQKTKEPFPRSAKFTEKVIDLAFENGLVLYPGTGFVDGVNGDMVMVGPPLIIQESQIDEIIEILQKTFSQI